MRVRAAVLLAVLLAASPARSAEGLAPLRRELDALLALERQGGWTFWSPPGVRPQPQTFGLRWAERIAVRLGVASWDLIVLRSPGTPEGALALLAGHRLLGGAEYLAAARRAGDLLLALQLASGGWFSEMPVEAGALPPWFPLVIAGPAIDDDVTPGAVRLLLALWEATGDTRYRGGAERGLALLLRAQLASGAWPLQVRRAWVRRLRPSYEDLATVNDGATPGAVVALIAGAHALGRMDLLAAARRGGDWLVRVRHATTQAGWAQQYDEAGRPAAGRRFERPGLASWESRHAIEALLALAAATGDRHYCAPIPEAVAWLERSAIGPGCWARLYAPGTNAPLFVAADGTAVAAPEKARPGYNWTGDYGIPALLARLGRGPTDGTTPPARLPGDPGTCPGKLTAEVAGDARAHIARAGTLLASIEGARPTPCHLPPLGLAPQPAARSRSKRSTSSRETAK